MYPVTVLAQSVPTARMWRARSSGKRARVPSTSFGPWTTIRKDSTKIVIVAATPVAAVLRNPSAGAPRLPANERILLSFCWM